MTGVGCPGTIPAHPPHKITSRLHARQAETRDWLRSAVPLSDRLDEGVPDTTFDPFGSLQHKITDTGGAV